jgi:hypothetical protein
MMTPGDFASLQEGKEGLSTDAQDFDDFIGGLSGVFHISRTQHRCGI